MSDAWQAYRATLTCDNGEPWPAKADMTPQGELLDAMIERAFRAGAAQSPDYYESHEVLGDIVSLESERQVLTGGGPGWRDRWDKAMQRACEIFEG